PPTVRGRRRPRGAAVPRRGRGPWTAAPRSLPGCRRRNPVRTRARGHGRPCARPAPTATVPVTVPDRLSTTPAGRPSTGTVRGRRPVRRERQNSYSSDAVVDRDTAQRQQL